MRVGKIFLVILHFFVCIYFRLNFILLSNHHFFSLHVSAVYGHHQVLSIMLKLLHCLAILHTACEHDIS
jgi:hypothetical protein